MKNLKIIKVLASAKPVCNMRRSVVKNSALRNVGFAVSLMSVCGVVVAQEQHNAHTHGVANLTLVSDSGTLEIAFDSPAVNLLGFEHRPRTQ